MVSPGLSSVPAKIIPIIRHWPPKRSPLPGHLYNWNTHHPQSEEFPAVSIQKRLRMIAADLRTPVPVTIRVVQMDPGPTPIFTASHRNRPGLCTPFQSTRQSQQSPAVLENSFLFSSIIQYTGIVWVCAFAATTFSRTPNKLQHSP